MSARRKEPDHYDWFGALQESFAQASALIDQPTLGPRARCLCGSEDARGRIIFAPVDLTATADDLTAEVNNEGQRPCCACDHGIPHGARCVVRYFGDTTTIRDYYHPSCVEI